MTSSAAHYARIVRDKADQRRAIQIAEEVPEGSARLRIPHRSWSAPVNDSWPWVAAPRWKQVGVGVGGRQRAFEAIDGHQREQAPGVQMVKIDCGILGLETTTTELRLIGARTSVGKTAFAHQLLLNAGQAGIAGGLHHHGDNGVTAWAAGPGLSRRVDVKRMVHLLTSRRSRHERPRRWRADGGVSPGQPMSITPPGRLLRSRGAVTVDQIGAPHRARGGKSTGCSTSSSTTPRCSRPSPHAEEQRHEQLSHAGTELKGRQRAGRGHRSPRPDQAGGRPARRQAPQMGDVRDCSTLVDQGRLRRDALPRGLLRPQQAEDKGPAGPGPRRTSRTYPSDPASRGGGIVKDRNHGRAGRTVGLTWFSEFQRFERLADPWEEWR